MACGRHVAGDGGSSLTWARPVKEKISEMMDVIGLITRGAVLACELVVLRSGTGWESEVGMLLQHYCCHEQLSWLEVEEDGIGKHACRIIGMTCVESRIAGGWRMLGVEHLNVRLLCLHWGPVSWAGSRSSPLCRQLSSGMVADQLWKLADLLSLLSGMQLDVGGNWEARRMKERQAITALGRFAEMQVARDAMSRLSGSTGASPTGKEGLMMCKGGEWVHAPAWYCALLVDSRATLQASEYDRVWIVIHITPQGMCGHVCISSLKRLSSSSACMCIR
jgi:hypothetical protein